MKPRGYYQTWKQNASDLVWSNVIGFTYKLETADRTHQIVLEDLLLIRE